jgi:transcriptional regulator with XRE-family HTH domain
MSFMMEALDVHRRIAERVRSLRWGQGLSLDALAARCGVSRAMISLIERGESSPTAVVLEKLATGLNVMLASLFDAAPSQPSSPISRAAEQTPWRDPHSGYVRRNLSPSGIDSPLQLVEVQFPPKARVAYDTSARQGQVHQQVWVLEGQMQITLGDAVHELAPGDCLAMVLDRPVSFHNPGRKTARYAVAIATLPAAALPRQRA